MCSSRPGPSGHPLLAAHHRRAVPRPATSCLAPPPNSASRGRSSSSRPPAPLAAQPTEAPPSAPPLPHAARCRLLRAAHSRCPSYRWPRAPWAPPNPRRRHCGPPLMPPWSTATSSAVRPTPPRSTVARPVSLGRPVTTATAVHLYLGRPAPTTSCPCQRSQPRLPRATWALWPPACTWACWCPQGCVPIFYLIL